MSIRTRKNLDEIAAKVNARLNTTMSVKEALEKELSARWAEFEQFMDSPRTEEEIAIALVPVRAAVSIVNDELRMERLEALKKLPYKDAVLDYLRTQCVTGYSIAKTSEEYSLDAKTSIYLDAYDFVAELCSADLNGIIDACCIFADNVARFAIGDDAAISKNSMHETYIELRKRKGWDVQKSKLSKSVLASQMTEICKFISCGIAPKMLNPDVTFVVNGIIQAKDKADAAGQFVKRDERTVVRFIFRAMYTRYNNLAYGFQDTTRASKGALGVKRNKDMAEPEQEKDATPEGGDVTVTIETPKAKESDKKSGKKSGTTRKARAKSSATEAPKAEEPKSENK